MYEIKEVIEFIVSFLIDKTGNEIFDKLKEKKKIEKLLNEDKKNIKKIFCTIDNSDLYNLVEQFIIYSAFKDPVFYSPMKLTEEQENKLWNSFKDFYKKENYIRDFDINISYKYKITRCVNLHNESINNIILSNQSKFHINVMQKQHEKIENLLYTIIDTLKTEVNFSDNDDDGLNFAVEQLECILKSYRFDISYNSILQTLYIVGLILLMSFIISFILLSYDFNRSIFKIPIYVLIVFFSFGGIIFSFLIKVRLRLDILERHMEKIRERLCNFHIKIYLKILENKYGISCYDKSDN